MSRFFSGRYASSKFRLVLLVVLLGCIVFTSARAFAQAPPAAGAETPTEQPAEGLLQLILGHKDPVFWTIAILSVVSLTLILQAFITNRSSVLIPEASTTTIRDLIGARKFKELLEFTETDTSFVSKSLNPALKRAPSFSSMKEAMETAIGEQTAEQFRKIEYLNIIGNLGPLLGLLGTVLGMIEAFSEMKAAGTADASRLAGGVSTALTHTFLGLFLAIPCLAAFGILRTIVDRLTVRAALLSEELLLLIKPSESRPASAASANMAGSGIAGSGMVGNMSVSGMSVAGVRPGAVPQPSAVPPRRTT